VLSMHGEVEVRQSDLSTSKLLFLTFRPRKTKHEDSHFRSFTGKIAQNYCAAQACGKTAKTSNPSHSAVGVGNGGCGPVRAVRCCRMFLAAKQQGTYIRRANHGKFLQGKIRRCAQA
jgi:hypothetical protein